MTNAAAGENSEPSLSDTLGALRCQVPKLLKLPLPLVGAVIYALLNFSYAAFYGNLGLRPDDVGLGYIQVLEQSLVALTFLTFVSLTIILVFLIPQNAFRKPWWLALTVTLMLVTVAFATFKRFFQPPLTTVAVSTLGALFLLAAAPFVRSMQHRVSNRFWPALLMVMAVTVVCLWLLELGPRNDANQVRSGITTDESLVDLPLFSYGASPATVYWPPGTPIELTSPPTTAQSHSRCLMYLGQASGTTVFYDVNYHTVLRISTDRIVVQVHSDWQTC